MTQSLPEPKKPYEQAAELLKDTINYVDKVTKDLFPSLTDDELNKELLDILLRDDNVYLNSSTLTDLRELIAREVKAARIDAYADCGSKGGMGTEVRTYAKSRADELQKEDTI